MIPPIDDGDAHGPAAQRLRCGETGESAAENHDVWL
jgi:hypothetical protein